MNKIISELNLLAIFTSSIERKPEYWRAISGILTFLFGNLKSMQMMTFCQSVQTFWSELWSLDFKLTISLTDYRVSCKPCIPIRQNKESNTTIKYPFYNKPTTKNIKIFLWIFLIWFMNVTHITPLKVWGTISLLTNRIWHEPTRIITKLGYLVTPGNYVHKHLE